MNWSITYKDVLVSTVTSGERTEYIRCDSIKWGSHNVFGQWTLGHLDRVFLGATLGTLPYPISYTLLHLEPVEIRGAWVLSPQSNPGAFPGGG